MADQPYADSHRAGGIAQAQLLVLEVRAKIIREDMGWTARQVDVAFDAQEKIDLLPVMTSLEGAELGLYSMEGRQARWCGRGKMCGVMGWSALQDGCGA